MRKILSLAIVGAILGIAASVQAKGGHHDAGCGVGAMIWKDNTKGQQILAATTNQWFAPSFSITSGTSGCTPEGMALRQKKRKVFVAVNYRALRRELAAGEGEYASSFASLMGCSGDGASAFLSHAKSNYNTLVPAGSTPEAMLSNAEHSVTATPSLAAVCTL
jgi:hypothetical protein